LSKGIDQVNQTQQRAAQLSNAFQRGEPGVELPQVMVEMQKASVSFRALTEVRNRVVSAYQEIMNMQV
jgi:flagellar hook-basal body complex protein FliE